MSDEVHTVFDFHDVPLEGVADFAGLPHYYEVEWDDEDDDYSSNYRLWPLDRATFALVQEAWAIWQRWEAAFYRGQTTRETHPALPEDRARHHDLEELLKPALRLSESRSFRASATFSRRMSSEWNGVGQAPLAVVWQRLE